MQLETELLLLCASPDGSPNRLARILELLNRGINWHSLQELAESHRLLPLLCWELNAIQPDAVPASLAESFRQNMRNSLFLTSELFRVLDLFEREGIPVIPFKGPSLAASVYGNIALRAFDDLDLLVRRENVWRARDLLLTRGGYQSRLQLNPARESAYLRSYDELVFHGPDEYPLLELHWAFLPPHFSVPINTADFWKRSTRLMLGNRWIPALSPEDLLLVVCLHGAKHCWSHLGLVSDVARVISSHEIDWDTALERARCIGVHRIVLLAASLAEQLLQVPLPETLVAALAADNVVPALASDIIVAIFGNGHDERAIVRSGLLHMRMRERLRDRLSYLVRLTIRPGIEDWRIVDLPGPLSFLYPALRFPRLAFKYRARIP